MQEESTPTQDESADEGPVLNLTAALERFILADREPWARNGKIYMSDLGIALGPDHAGCPVAWYLKMRDAPTKEMNAGRILMTQAGDLLHDHMADLLKMALPMEGWRVLKVEKRTYLDTDLEGVTIGARLDVLIEHIATGIRAIIDVKTKRGNAFGYLDEPKYSDELQVQGYIKAEDADHGYLLYVDREGQNFCKDFFVPREDHRVDKALEILNEMNSADEPPETLTLGISITENKGADSVYLKKPWQIEWCDLETCACAAAFPHQNVPTKVAAKLHPGEDSVEVRLTDAGAKWGDIIVKLLNEQADEGVTYVLKEAEPEE